MVVDVKAAPDFEASAPRELFRGDFDEHAMFANPRSYDVSPDGQRLLMIQMEESRQRRIEVVLNWFEELRARAPL